MSTTPPFPWQAIDVVARDLLADLMDGKIAQIGCDEVEAAFNGSSLGLLVGDVREASLYLLFRRVVERTAAARPPGVGT